MKVAKYSKGFLLIEALVGIAIFSIGIIGIMGLMGASIQLSSDATYRVAAGQFANQIAGQMMSGIDRTTTAAAQLTALQNNYATNGAYFNTWLTNVQKSLPAAQATITVNQAALTSTSVPSNQAMITISWKPTELKSTDKPHTFSTLVWIR